MNISKTTLTLAMTVALGAAGSVNADQSQNPFGMQHLNSGYIQLAEAKTTDGKCGNNNSGMETKASDGKCGNNAAKPEPKVKDGKCAANTPQPEDKVKDGNCAANKQSNSMDRGTAKSTEAKCGEGKCGNNA
jgi:uncharacterized low-complexity protein